MNQVARIAHWEEHGMGAGSHEARGLAHGVVGARRPAAFETLGRVFMPAQK